MGEDIYRYFLGSSDTKFKWKWEIDEFYLEVNLFSFSLITSNFLVIILTVFVGWFNEMSLISDIFSLEVKNCGREENHYFLLNFCYDL